MNSWRGRALLLRITAVSSTRTPRPKKKKIQGNTGSGGAAVEWMQFTAENANTALFGASVS